MSTQDLEAGKAKHRAQSPESQKHGPVNIFSIQGGLGNQLFEWGLAHTLAASGGRVAFDTVRCRGNRPLAIGGLLRGYERLRKPWGYAAVLAHKSGLLTRTAPLANQLRLVSESGFSHDPHLVDRLLTGDHGRNYVLGYFQSPKYFAGQEDAVRTVVLGYLESMLTPAGVSKTRELSQTPGTVAVHVRRGDYVNNPVAAAHHGNLQGDYYAQALELVRDLGKHRVMWFSDDTEWVRNELARAEDIVATPAMMAGMTTAAGGEIALMAACSSRVIANSSFSWWGGWLGQPASEESPIIAPLQWIAGSGDTAPDLVPEQWVRF
ncbi:hypothetical protein CVS30_16015 [Arthrobacter psychrolactophilus]|uniref:Alpha-1,2-fucosyltransferase n=1 Tax=Arthrobacter psychrolactophilus TaxID=92442 RepID=A0A2V5IKY3_9MICC|nr:alpha-1,2-fucosyltransferase [Arthrobacter psychrolactophilus]PYI37319.1 hypothetical protein CVS30_16015 [Arthrobacter psychrolactophilus]